MSQFDELEPNENTESSVGTRAARNAEKKTSEKPSGFKEKFVRFMRKLTDPNRRAKKNLPDLADYPLGKAPLWVTDPDHYCKKKSRTRRFFGALGTVFLHMFLIFSMIGVVVVGVGVAVIYSFSDPALDERFASMDLDHSSFIYATDPTTGENSIYQEIQSNSGRRVWVSGEEIPQHVKDAAVALEDKRFYTHPGVDIVRTVNAVLEYGSGMITGSGGRSSGGSTLTQQVIKNMTGDDDYSISRKVKEMLQALYIERRYDKDQILEYYLNTVYFGNGANGISAAADIYFGKDVSELTVTEGAAIVAITQLPSKYEPVKNPENNRERRNNTLWFMHEQGYLTREEYDRYSKEDLNLVYGTDRTDKIQDEDGVFLYNYYTDMVLRDVQDDLIAAGYTKAEANRLIYRGGLQIYACVDTDIQGIMEEYFVNDENYYTSSEKKKYSLEKLREKYSITVGEGENAVVEIPQVAMMVMDPDTGAILGVIGGRGEKNSSLDLNRATSAPRQPGSSIKPLSIYGYAIENNLLNPGSPIDDVPVETRKSDKYKWPSNYSGSYSGLVSVKKALSWSLNTTAARGLQLVGVSTSFDFMKNSLHFTTLVEADKASLAPLSVGALTNGVTLRELTTAYTVFAGGGMYSKYRSYSKVVAYDGKTILDNTAKREPVFSEETAYLITDILEAALNTGGSSDPAELKGIATAGKSGTTSFFKDRWFIGYTPYYLGGIWWGYDTPNTLENTHHVQMWHDVMEQIHVTKGITSGEFARPGGVKWVKNVCWKSGKLATELCSQDGCVGNFWFKTENIPTKYCDVHHQLNVCTASGCIAHEGCTSVTPAVFVDVERSFNFAISIKDAGSICPPLTAGSTLYVSDTLPVYAHMVPDKLSPSYNKSGANRICQVHTPAEKPHYNAGTSVPDVPVTPPSPPPVTDTPVTPPVSSDTGTPSESTPPSVSSDVTDSGNPPDDGTVTDSGTPSESDVSDSGNVTDSVVEVSNAA